jgi:hypothetical protein
MEPSAELDGGTLSLACFHGWPPNYSRSRVCVFSTQIGQLIILLISCIIGGVINLAKYDRLSFS